jgi:hypothetical protein
MTCSLNDGLMNLARHMQRTLPPEPEAWQEALEESLLPMVRCALRKGIGLPTLVRWVRHEVEANPDAAADPARAAVPMARELSQALLERINPLSGRETVVGV